MRTGISIYPGLDSTASDMAELLKKCAVLGISRVFTSLHIPETNTEALQKDLHILLTAAQHYNMDVIADISPATQALLNLDALTPDALLNLGITTVRFDFGFDIHKAALFSKAMHVQINASTIQKSDVQALRQAGADFSHIDGLHNFYPRPHTGLDENYFYEQTKWLQDEGIRIGAFIASQAGRRGPIYAGLPTLEMHRTMDVSLASRHLAALGLQSVFMGDANPSDEELRMLSSTGQEEKDTIVLKARLLSQNHHIRDLLSYVFTSRLDPARDVIRTQESRHHLDGLTIDHSGPFRSLRRGDITIDNIDYLRYMGEVQIILNDQAADERTNIVAEVLPAEQFLLPLITPGRKFRLEWVR